MNDQDSLTYGLLSPMTRHPYGWSRLRRGWRPTLTKLSLSPGKDCVSIWEGTTEGEKIAERIADIRDRIESEMSGSAAGRDFVGVFNGAIVGFTAPYVEPGGRRRVGALYVLPAAQGLGIGHLLIEVNLHWHSGDPGRVSKCRRLQRERAEILCALAASF